jgi:hypothetical protein
MQTIFNDVYGGPLSQGNVDAQQAATNTAVAVAKDIGSKVATGVDVVLDYAPFTSEAKGVYDAYNDPNPLNKAFKLGDKVLDLGKGLKGLRSTDFEDGLRSALGGHKVGNVNASGLKSREFDGGYKVGDKETWYEAKSGWNLDKFSRLTEQLTDQK